jgi:exodeoxyribonuclease V alpha subunit
VNCSHASGGGRSGRHGPGGILERAKFANPETGYTIARIAPEGGGADLVTAVGPLPGAQIGEFLRLRGCWSTHPKYGRQFEVVPYATVLPTTADNPQAGTATQSPILPK